MHALTPTPTPALILMRHQDWFITPLGNMATPSRIWDALQKVLLP